jgi:tektin-4
VQEAKTRLEEELKRICGTIVMSEKAVEAIKQAIKAKEDPMKVAQTRLHQREFRPNVELCRDPAQYGLIEEVHLLSQSTDALLQKLVEAENDLRALQDQRMVLEKDISVKKNSLFVDREKCLPHRTRNPTITQLQGY